jgi:Gas vesicle protein
MAAADGEVGVGRDARIGTRAGTEPESGSPAGQIALVDLLDRLLGAGVVLAGDIVISLSGVDLVQVRLHALITTIRADMMEPR